MVSEKMYELGTKKSTIRTIFEFGRKRAAEVGEDAAARLGGEAPLARRLLIDVAGVHEGAAELEGTAEEALADELPGALGGGQEARLEGHLGDAMVAGERGGYLLGLLKGGGQGLVAVDVLAVRHGAEQGLAVEVVGRADVDDVDVGRLRDGAEVGDALHAQEFAGGAGAVRMARADAHQLRREGQAAEEERQIAVRKRMDLTNVPKADQTHSIRAHSSPDCSKTALT